MSLLIEYLANFADALLGVWFVTKLNRSSFQRAPFFLPAVALTFGILVFFTHFAEFGVWQTLLFFAVLAAYAFTLKKTSLARRILAPVIFHLVIILGNTAVIFVMSQVLQVSIEQLVTHSFLGRYLHILLCKIVTVVVLALIARFFTIEERFSWSDLLLYLIFPSITLLNLYLFIHLGIRYDLSAHAVLILVLTLVLALLNVLILALFQRSSKQAKEKHELELLNLRSESEKRRYEDLKEAHQQLQVLRHDIKEHLKYVQFLTEKGEHGAVAEYLRKINGELSSGQRVYCTNNRVLDYIIASKFSAKPHVSFLLVGIMENLKAIEEGELASLFGNLLDNAIEAAEKSESPLVELSFLTQGNYQSIICKNSVAQSPLKTDRSLSTTKKDKSLHGFGLKSIRRTVEKHEGMMEIYEENQKFCVQILLPIASV